MVYRLLQNTTRFEAMELKEDRETFISLGAYTIVFHTEITAIVFCIKNLVKLDTRTE